MIFKTLNSLSANRAGNRTAIRTQNRTCVDGPLVMQCRAIWFDPKCNIFTSSSKGRAVFTLKSVYNTRFELSMKEELTVFDTEPNPDIEMCNGTAEDLETRDIGEEKQMFEFFDWSLLHRL
jgi:hypothetical protein